MPYISGSQTFLACGPAIGFISFSPTRNRQFVQLQKRQNFGDLTGWGNSDFKLQSVN